MVVELTVAVVLLAGAGLLAKSFYRLLHVETGFDTSHLATVYVMAPDSVYGKPEQQVALYHQILEKVSALPGVTVRGYCQRSSAAVQLRHRLDTNSRQAVPRRAQ